MDLNTRLVEKADTLLANLSSGGLLFPDQATEFFEKVIDQPTILREARIEYLNSNKMQVDKIGFGTRILQKPADEVTAVTATAPDLSKVTLDTKEFVAQVNIGYRTLEANIEKENFADRVINMMARRVAFDMEEIIIQGDTVGGADTFLKTLDGILVQLDGGNIFDNTSAAISKTTFKGAIKELPDKYKRMLNLLRFYVAPNAEVDYRDTMINQATPNLGQGVITGMNPVYAYGVPVAPASHMPLAKGLLIDPTNIIVGFHRQVRIETQRDIEKRLWKIVLSLAFDVKIEETDAAVRIDNIA